MSAEDEKAGRHEFVGSGDEFCWHWIGTPGSRYACGQSASATCHLPPATKAGQTREGAPWPLRDVLSKLISAAEHLLLGHNCDTHGHEVVQAAIKAGHRLLSAPDTAAELAKTKASLDTANLDWAEAHTHAQKAAKAVGVDPVKVDGDSYGVPGIEDLVDMIVAHEAVGRDALKAGTDKREASAFARMEELRVEWQRAEADRDRLAARVGEAEAEVARPVEEIEKANTACDVYREKMHEGNRHLNTANAALDRMRAEVDRLAGVGVEALNRYEAEVARLRDELASLHTSNALLQAAIDRHDQGGGISAGDCDAIGDATAAAERRLADIRADQEAFALRTSNRELGEQLAQMTAERDSADRGVARNGEKAAEYFDKAEKLREANRELVVALESLVHPSIYTTKHNNNETLMGWSGKPTAHDRLEAARAAIAKAQGGGQ